MGQPASHGQCELWVVPGFLCGAVPSKDTSAQTVCGDVPERHPPHPGHLKAGSTTAPFFLPAVGAHLPEGGNWVKQPCKVALCVSGFQCPRPPCRRAGAIPRPEHFSHVRVQCRLHVSAVTLYSTPAPSLCPTVSDTFSLCVSNSCLCVLILTLADTLFSCAF